MQLAFVSILTLAYPLLVFFGIGHFEPRSIALLLAALALVRGIAMRQQIWLLAAAGALCLAGISIFANQLLPLKLYPVLVNGVLLAAFGISLAYPPTLIERLARLQEPDLPPKGIAYTRNVTKVWCAFFLVNGSVALITALWCSSAVWALYNGVISYVLMGSLFGVEWLIRRRVKARIDDE